MALAHQIAARIARERAQLLNAHRRVAFLLNTLEDCDKVAIYRSFKCELSRPTAI